MNSESVVLIADREFGSRLDSIADGTAIWVVDSSSNHSAIMARRKTTKAADHLTGLTSFLDNSKLSQADLAASVADTIEEHHGAYSRRPPFSKLVVLGAPLTTNLVSALANIDFELESKSESSLLFARRAVVPNQS